jgi:predicted nucleotidyltransferase
MSRSPTSRPSLPASVERALGRFRSLLVARFGPRLLELTLFGSRARGDAHEDSDADVLVVVEGLAESERHEVMDLAYDADSMDRDAWIGLSPLPYSEAQVRDLRARERLLLRDIERDGVPV